MAIDKQMRARIDKLIEVYLNDLESTTKSAGWHQPSTLQMLIDYQGDLPGRSGMDRSNDKMVREMEFIRGEHVDLGLAKHLLGSPVGTGEVPKHQALAVLASRFYRGKSGDEIAVLMGMTLDQYKGRLSRGREVMALELLKTDRLFGHLALAG
ncbi:hypothetical protein [Marinobacterium litorale]|uniref:hypothetical protein n=1 Tax=Marinobacterium litorale TaxID=404770 RepID=UPI000424FBF3|nr:hypothetical protein [Marinobacterium litorale]